MNAVSLIRLWPVAFCALSMEFVNASPQASVGALDERALQFHEAWLEAKLSMDAPQLDREWKRLVQSLTAALQGKARVSVNGNSIDWRIELKPPVGQMMVRLDTTGSRVTAQRDTGPVEPRTLESVYPWRRHYDCDGRPLNPAKPGVPVPGKPCAPPPKSEWQTIREAISNEDGVVVQPLKGMPCCFLVVSETKGILIPGQILVEQAGQRYKMRRLNDVKVELQYRDNRWLFVRKR